MSKYVSFEDSRFAVQKAKESTARIALWRELGIDNVFTLEGSFYGYIQDVSNGQACINRMTLDWLLLLSLSCKYIVILH